MPGVAKFHARNEEFSRTVDFVPFMIAQVKLNLCPVVRVHVAGDFYDAEYVEKWVTIAKATPRTTYFAYTRSWAVPEILPSLIRLSQSPNVCLWFSSDLELGSPPLVGGVRVAYMAINDVDAGNAPPDCDLVFRDRPDKPMKRANGVMVCPAENGVPGRMKHTCTSCGICWDRQRRPGWESLLLPLLGTIDEGIAIKAPEAVAC